MDSHVAQCLSCGYDLRAQPLAGRCPECGAAVLPSAVASLIPDRQPGWFRIAQLYLALLVALVVLFSGVIVGYACFDYLRVLIAGTAAEKAAAWGDLLVMLFFSIVGAGASLTGLLVTQPSRPEVWRRRGRLRFWLVLRWLFWLSLGSGLALFLGVLAVVLLLSPS